MTTTLSTGTATEPAASGRPRRRRRRLLLLLIPLSLLVCFATDVAATAALQAIGIYQPASAQESKFRCAHPLYHHGLRPNVNSEYGGSWGHLRYTISTNSLGMKDAAPRQVDLRPAGRRLLLIGDSFTEGVGLAFEQTFAGILAEALRSQGVEVLNAGCVTYAPVIYCRKVQALLADGLVFDHLVVCLDMSDIVDEIKYYRLDEHGNVVKRVERFGEAVKLFIAEHTIVTSWLRRLIHEIRHIGRGPEVPFADHERSSWTRDDTLWRRYGEPGLASAAVHLDALRRLLQARGIGMTLVVYPWPDQILHAERQCAQVTYWREWAQRSGVAFVDAFPAFLDAGPAAQVIEQNFIAGDVHWNAAGHARIARLLLAELRF